MVVFGGGCFGVVVVVLVLFWRGKRTKELTFNAAPVARRELVRDGSAVLPGVSRSCGPRVSARDADGSADIGPTSSLNRNRPKDAAGIGILDPAFVGDTRWLKRTLYMLHLSFQTSH